jgi:type VI secretion system protein ImpE
MVRTGPGFKGTELGEVLIPVLSPLSWQHSDDEVRLGHATVWEESEEGEEVPFGQKMLMVDGEEIPLLEVRSVRIAAQPQAAATEGVG